MPEQDHGEDKLSERLSRGTPLAAIVLVVLALVLAIAYLLLPVLKLVAIAMLLALVVRTAMDGLERLGAPPWLAVLAILAGVAAFGAFVRYVIIPSILDEARAIVSEAPELLRALPDSLVGLPFVPENLSALVSGELAGLPRQLEGYLSGLAGSLPEYASTASAVTAGVIAILFLTVYFAFSPETYVSGVLSLMPRRHRGRGREIVERIGQRLKGWILGTILVSLFVGVGAGIGLWALGIPLALTFGIIAGVLNVIPYLGVVVGGALPGLLALTISPVKALMVGVLFLILDQVDGNVLRPLIFSREVEIPPAWVLISILVLAVLLGPVIGAFLAIPAAVVLKVLKEELIDPRPPPKDGGEEKPSGDPHA